MFLTEKYIEQKAAYEIPEYFPRSGDYTTWRSFENSQKGFTSSLIYKTNTPFYKEIETTGSALTLPIHYFPFWNIQVNDIQIVPASFDKLGRPLLTNLPAHSIVTIRYNETPIEKSGDVMTIIIFGMLLVACSNVKLWKKTNTILQ